jgi:general secretion pathway protein A
VLRFRDQPFENTRDPRFFYPSQAHAEAVARLRFTAENRNMAIGLLTGEIGCGKTLSANVVSRQLDPLDFKVVMLENCLYRFDDLLLEILSQMRGARLYPNDLPDRYSRVTAFKEALMGLVVAARRHLVLMLDEAQQLHTEDLEALKALTNLASDQQNHLTLLLIGQPELARRVQACPPVDQRVSLRYHLAPLSPEEVGEYMEHRLRTAGLEAPSPITPEAVRLVARASQGIPREINRISKLALEHAMARGDSRVSETVVHTVIQDLQGQTRL